MADEERSDLSGPRPRAAVELDDLVRCIPGVVFVRAEATGSIGFVSGAIEDLLGFEAHEWYAYPPLWEEQIHPADRAPVMDKRRIAFEAGHDLRAEYRMYTREGRLRWVREQSRLVSEPDPTVCGLAIDVSDWMWSGEMIGEIHQDQTDLISDLRGATNRLRTSLRLMAHDARRPLAASRELMSRLTESPGSESQQAELLRGMRERLTQLESLVQEIVDNERVDEGALEVEARDRVVLSELVHEVLVNVDTGTHTIQVALGEESVWMPRNILERIVRNLLWNAVTHTPPKTAVTVRAEPATGGLVLIVEDDGPGVPDEIKESIFEPFDRGRATETTGGLGLGLSLVRRLVSMLNGEVWVEDSPHGGASFRVRIPTDARPQARGGGQ